MLIRVAYLAMTHGFAALRLMTLADPKRGAVTHSDAQCTLYRQDRTKFPK